MDLHTAALADGALVSRPRNGDQWQLVVGDQCNIGAMVVSRHRCPWSDHYLILDRYGAVGDHITNDNTPTLTGTAEANSTVKVFDGATLLGSAIANGAGAWTYTTAALADGAHSLAALATDVAGNTSATGAALNLTIDTAAPLTPVLTGQYNMRGFVYLVGSADANSTVSIYDAKAALVGTCLAVASGLLQINTNSRPM